MTEFTTDELFDAIDRLVRDVLDRHNVAGPPVDAERLAVEEFDLILREADPDEDDAQPGRFGPRPPRRPNYREVALRHEMTAEGRQAACARACAKALIPRVLAKLKVPAGGDQQRSAQSQLIGLITPRLLLPTKWFGRDTRKLGHDVLAIKALYSTAGYVLIALRMLDVADDPCVMAVVDDGAVAARRGNQAPAGRTLTKAEAKAAARAVETGDPVKVRADGWTAWGWPVPGGPFNRIILRSVPDDL